jgi:large subunit ribosomal protein L2
MGKNLPQQRRGKGTPRYRSPSHRFKGKPKYQIREGGQGIVTDIIHDPGRSAPLSVVRFDSGEGLMIAPEGIHIGQTILYEGRPEVGNVLRLKDVPEGTKIHNIELAPGDGGRLCKAGGASATVISHIRNKTIILLPSKKRKTLSSNCRATVGTVAGSGRKEKPFMKAGNKFYALRAKNKLYPRTRGVAKNALDHPFGGSTKPGKHKTVSRHTSPGAKVGSISPRRTGKRKR